MLTCRLARLFALAAALCFALTKEIWELFCSICSAWLKKLGLKRQAGILIMLISGVFQGREDQTKLQLPKCTFPTV